MGGKRRANGPGVGEGHGNAPRQQRLIGNLPEYDASEKRVMLEQCFGEAEGLRALSVTQRAVLCNPRDLRNSISWRAVQLFWDRRIPVTVKGEEAVGHAGACLAGGSARHAAAG